MRSSPVVIAALLSLVALPVRAQYLDVNQPLVHPVNQPFFMTAVGGPSGIGTGSANAQQSFLPNHATISGGGFYWHYPSGVAWPEEVRGQPIPSQQVFEISLSMTTLPVGDPYIFPPYNSLQTLVTQQVTFGLGAGWVDAFWNPISVTPGATYFVGIKWIQAPFNAGVGFNPSNPYADGRAWVNGTCADYGGIPLNCPTYDYTFRTFTSVPEPSTYAMMAAGLLALGILARKRRNV